MWRFLLSSWWYSGGPVLGRALGSLVFTAVVVRLGWLSPTGGVVLGIGLVGWLNSDWFIGFVRFSGEVRRHQSIQTKDAVIYYPPDLGERLRYDELLRCCRQENLRLQEHFGFPLRRRLEVYVMPSCSVLSKMFQVDMGCCALVRGDALIVTPEPLEGLPPAEVLRHELAHLYSAYLGGMWPSFKSEGLSVWLQETQAGLPVHLQALTVVQGTRYTPFRMLLDEEQFFSRGWDGYLMAGSFTGYLIQNHGWSSYSTFFSGARARGFSRRFERHFGLPLAEAEAHWRQWLLAKSSEYGDPLRREVHRRRLEHFAANGYFVAAVEELETLRRSELAELADLANGALAHLYLGNATAARSLLREALELPHPLAASYRPSLLVLLGQALDLAGEREQAKKTYAGVLQEPDYWDAAGGSRHEMARRLLRKPITAADLQEQWQDPIDLRGTGPTKRKAWGKWGS